MKSKQFLVAISILFLLLAVVASVVFWADVSPAAKIGMFAFGFGAGGTAGGYLAKNR